MPVVNGYCTENDLREQLGDLASQNLSAAQLQRAINAASRAVDQWCNRRFWADAAPVTRTIPVVAGGYELWLDGIEAGDIAYTAGLVVASDTNGDGSYSTVWDATDYRLWPYGANQSGSEYYGWSMLESTGRKRFDVRGLNGIRGILPLRVTARFGWSAVPVGVEQATILKAAQLFKRKDAPFGVVQFGDIAAVTVTRKDADVVELLWPYVRDVAMVA